MKVMLVETNLSTAGVRQGVWWLYDIKNGTKEIAKEFASYLFHDDGTGWETIKKKGWEVNVLDEYENYSSSKLDELNIEDFNEMIDYLGISKDDIYYECDFPIKD